MTDELRSTLHGLRLLLDFPDEFLSQLESLARIEEFPGGAVIFRQGDPARTVYVVADGTVSLEICAAGVGCRRILTVVKGELLGWSPLLSHDRLTATARAQSPTRLVAIDGGKLLALFEQQPRFGYQFMQRAAVALAQRLNATRLQLLDLYGGEMPHAPDTLSAAD